MGTKKDRQTKAPEHAGGEKTIAAAEFPQRGNTDYQLHWPRYAGRETAQRFAASQSALLDLADRYELERGKTPQAEIDAGHQIDPDLEATLHDLFDKYGVLGVITAAAQYGLRVATPRSH